MAAQNSSASLAFASPRSHASQHRSDKPKRARTKHACDECRRSQKRCDGQKPICARCKANGTTCSYTPHKARNQCICTGPDAKEGHHELVPEVVVFNHGAATYHTGTFSSLNCSPEQLPSQAGMLTPSPTFASHDEMLVQEPSAFYSTRASAGQQTNEYSMHAAPHYVPAPHHQQFHNQHNNAANMQVHVQRTQLYSHRSHSMPNVSTTLTPVARAPFVSPPVVSTCLPHYTSQSSYDQHSPTSDSSSFSSPYAAQFALQQQQPLNDSPTSLYDSLLLPSSLAAPEAGTGGTGVHDFTHTPPTSDSSVNHSTVNHSTYTFYPRDDRPSAPLPTSSYSEAANLAIGQDQQQHFTPVDAHGQQLLPSHLYGAASVSTNTATTPSDSSSATQQQNVYGSLLFHDDGLVSQGSNHMSVLHPSPPYYSQEIAASQYELGMQQQQQLHSPLGISTHGYQGSSPLLSSQHENFVNSHTPSPNPPATPTDSMLPHPHPHVQLHHQYGYSGANEQGQDSLSLPPPPTSHLLRWPSSSSPLTVHTGTSLLDAHTEGGSGSAGPSPTSYGNFDYPVGGLHGQWTQ